MSEIAAKIDIVIKEMQELYRLTELPFFDRQAAYWIQWVWMLNDNAREEWGIVRPGHPDGHNDGWTDKK
jgi:hypothetical protein